MRIISVSQHTLEALVVALATMRDKAGNVAYVPLHCEAHEGSYGLRGEMVRCIEVNGVHLMCGPDTIIIPGDTPYIYHYATTLVPDAK